VGCRSSLITTFLRDDLVYTQSAAPLSQGVHLRWRITRASRRAGTSSPTGPCAATGRAAGQSAEPSRRQSPCDAAHPQWAVCVRGAGTSESPTVRRGVRPQSCTRDPTVGVSERGRLGWGVPRTAVHVVGVVIPTLARARARIRQTHRETVRVPRQPRTGEVPNRTLIAAPITNRRRVPISAPSATDAAVPLCLRGAT
jgi:hypothetical protein